MNTYKITFYYDLDEDIIDRYGELWYESTIIRANSTEEATEEFNKAYKNVVIVDVERTFGDAMDRGWD